MDLEPKTSGGPGEPSSLVFQIRDAKSDIPAGTHKVSMIWRRKATRLRILFAQSRWPTTCVPCGEPNAFWSLFVPQGFDRISVKRIAVPGGEEAGERSLPWKAMMYGVPLEEPLYVAFSSRDGNVGPLTGSTASGKCKDFLFSGKGVPSPGSRGCQDGAGINVEVDGTRHFVTIAEPTGTAPDPCLIAFRIHASQPYQATFHGAQGIWLEESSFDPEEPFTTKTFLTDLWVEGAKGSVSDGHRTLSEPVPGYWWFQGRGLDEASALELTWKHDGTFTVRGLARKLKINGTRFVETHLSRLGAFLGLGWTSFIALLSFIVSIISLVLKKPCR